MHSFDHSAEHEYTTRGVETMAQLQSCIMHFLEIEKIELYVLSSFLLFVLHYFRNSCFYPKYDQKNAPLISCLVSRSEQEMRRSGE